MAQNKPGMVWLGTGIEVEMLVMRYIWLSIMSIIGVCAFLGQAMTSIPASKLNPADDPNLSMPDKRKPNHVFGFEESAEVIEVIDTLNAEAEWSEEWSELHDDESINSQ